MKFKLKVCGMKNYDNIKELIKLNPDYIGYIFYKNSKRFVGENPDKKILDIVPENILKTGVFVNESIQNVINTKYRYNLNLIQLHGDETVQYCNELKSEISTKIIKAFQIYDDFDFEILNEYKPYCDYFLFDSKTNNYGGSGKKFNWQILDKYNLETPIFLSGGIDLNDAAKIKNMNIYAIDVNSKFETEPGFKDIEKLKKFTHDIRKSKT